MNSTKRRTKTTGTDADQTQTAPPWFALAIADDRGDLSYVSRSWSPGNVMRCSRIARAEIWPSIAELTSWADALSPAGKRQIAGRQLLVVPVTIAPGAATHTFEFPENAIPPDEEPRGYGPSVAVVRTIGGATS